MSIAIRARSGTEGRAEIGNLDGADLRGIDSGLVDDRRTRPAARRASGYGLREQAVDVGLGRVIP
ncbi:MAG: hypothetical protein ABI703_03645 [Gemmatimonadales bacterium]